MTKTKRTLIAGFTAIALTCSVAGSALAALAAPVTARADEPTPAPDYVSDVEGNAVYPGGDSRTEVMAALDAKIAETNAKIKEFNEAGTALATAYANGELLAYSSKDGSNGVITTANNRRSGWKIWDGAPLLDLKFINAGYGDWGDQYVAWLSYDGIANKAYFITAEFANEYANNGKKLGTAMGDMFAATGGGVKYQNFAGGYMKLEGGRITTVSGKNVTADGAESPADPTANGFVGAASEEIAAETGLSLSQIYQAFEDAYKRYQEDGFNVGYPFKAVEKSNTIIWQSFRDGDSVSDPWGDSSRKQWSYLALNPDEGHVYLIKDEFAHAGDSNGDSQQIGAPLGDVFEANGNRYQNFANGYMWAEGTTPQNKAATIVKNKNVDKTGTEQEISADDIIGAFGPTVKDENLPEGFTRDTFSAAFKTAYTEKVKYETGEELASASRVAYGTYFYQDYTDNNGKVHRLAYSETAKAFVYLRPAVVEKLTSELGAPAGERIEVASTATQKIYAYPFTNGYVRLTHSEQQSIEEGEIVTVIREVASMTSGATFDSEKNFFETESFADSITADIVATSGNESVNSAYWTIWGVSQPSAAELAAKFKEAYEAAFAIGFSAGEPATGGIGWWTTGNSGVIKLTLHGGNGNASFWGDNTLMTYNPDDGNVYISTGAVATHYANDGASGNGWATSEMLINSKTGVIVQQFDITDSVVTHRQIYIIVSEAGQASKNDGVYDLEANKAGGEWVPYLTQFGGSISAKVVNLEPFAKDSKVTVDFSQYVNNADGYKLTWNVAGGKGSITEAGVFTLEELSENTEITVEVYSAFDKLTFNVTLTVEGSTTPGGTTPGGTTPGGTTPGGNTPGGNTPGGEQPGGEEPAEESGCGSVIASGSILLVLAAATAAIVLVRKKKQDQ